MKITQTSEDSWTVESDSGNTYDVWDAGIEDAEYGGGMHCDCPAGKHGRSCKHVRAVIEFDRRGGEMAIELCSCVACGCAEPATTTDDAGSPVCDACADYTTDEGGILCGNCTGVEYVTESCGAGGQTRTYLRTSPPDQPPNEPTGQWACVWESADDPPEVRSRHSTRELAEQAVAAHDWPPPGEHTSYLCGYSVMRLSGGRWLPTEEEDDE